MNHAEFRFYEELNDFLPVHIRKKSFTYSFRGTPAVKDAIEAIGVPHVEIDLILVNGISVDFSYKLRDADSVSVYPVFESFDISSVTHLREKPLRETKFILDVHLGKLAKYLRVCGFDTLYRTDYDDLEIIGIALSEGRIILTRDVELLKNKKLSHACWLRSQHVREQIKEVFLRFDLLSQVSLFTRCLECNTVLRDIPKEEVLENLLPGTRLYQHKFKECPDCKKIFWPGSHYQRMKKFMENLTAEL